MKRTIVFTAMALLISAGVMAQSADQVRTQTRTEAQTQVQTQQQVQNQVQEQTQVQDPVMTQTRTRQQTRLQTPDGSQARIQKQDQARINRQARIHQNTANPDCPNQGQAIRSAAMQRNAMRMSGGAGAGRR